MVRSFAGLGTERFMDSADFDLVFEKDLIFMRVAILHNTSTTKSQIYHNQKHIQLGRKSQLQRTLSESFVAKFSELLSV